MTPAPENHSTYQPSVFYFRKDLRESRSRDRAITVALVVCAELEQLRGWAGAQSVIPGVDATAAVECLRAAIRQSSSHSQAILLGLFLCHELEQLKALVRNCGFIPPKWIVAPEEAHAKGWDLEDAVNL
jgi:hypothetical protein